MVSIIQKKRQAVDDATWSILRSKNNQGGSLRRRMEGTEIQAERMSQVEKRQGDLVLAPESEEPTSTFGSSLTTRTDAASNTQMASDFAEFKSTTLQRMESMASNQTILTVVISLLGALVIGLLVLVVLLYKKRRATQKATVHLIPDIEKPGLTPVIPFDSRLRRLSSPKQKPKQTSARPLPTTPQSTTSSQATVVATNMQKPGTPMTPATPPKTAPRKLSMPKEVADEVTGGDSEKLFTPHSMVSPVSVNKIFGIPYRSSRRLGSTAGLDSNFARAAVELPTEMSRPASRIDASPKVQTPGTPVKDNTPNREESLRSRSKSMSENRHTSVPPSVMKMAMEMQRRKTIELGDREDLQRLLVPTESGNGSKRSSKRISNIPGIPPIPNTRFSAIMINVDAQEKIPVAEPSPAYSIMSENSVLKSPKYKFGGFGRKSRSGSIKSIMETSPPQNERAVPPKDTRRSPSEEMKDLPQINISTPQTPRRASAGAISTPVSRNPISHFSAPPVPPLPDMSTIMQKGRSSPELKSTPKMTPSKCSTPTEPVSSQAGVIENFARSASPEKLYPCQATFNLFPANGSPSVTSPAASSRTTSPEPKTKRYTAYTARSSINSVGGHLIDRERNLLYASQASSPPLPSPSQFPPVPPLPRKHNSAFIQAPKLRPESYGVVRQAATAPNSTNNSPDITPTPSPPLQRISDQPPTLPEISGLGANAANAAARVRETVYNLGGFFQNVGRN